MVPTSSPRTSDDVLAQIIQRLQLMPPAGLHAVLQLLDSLDELARHKDSGGS